MASFGETGGPQCNFVSPNGQKTEIAGLDNNGDYNFNVDSDDGKIKTTGPTKDRTFDKGQYNQVLTDATNISWDGTDMSCAEVTLAGNRTLDNITSASFGTYSLIVKQDATGSRTLSYGNQYKFEGGTAPTLSTAANAEDLLVFYSCENVFMLVSCTKNYS